MKSTRKHSKSDHAHRDLLIVAQLPPWAVTRLMRGTIVMTALVLAVAWLVCWR
jgi:hypothetical protein